MMRPYNELDDKERKQLENAFYKSKIFETEFFSEAPYIQMEDGTILWIEGVTLGEK